MWYVDHRWSSSTKSPVVETATPGAVDGGEGGPESPDFDVETGVFVLEKRTQGQLLVGSVTVETR